MKAPEALDTVRLRLRRPRASDVEAVFRRYAGDPEATRYLAWPTHESVDDTRAFLSFSDAEWDRWPAAAYLIHRRTDGILLGSTGLSFATDDHAITGYVLARDAWGRGYATEALTAMVALARTLGVRRVSAGCHPDHLASQRVLEKCGFVLEELRRRAAGFPNLGAGESQDLLLYGRIP
jgi:RimJ/RimL family protein N-acetyltransferase